MKYALCTISFRHGLVSFGSLVEFATQHGFDGIELWGAHATYLAGEEPERTKEQLRIMHSRGKRITMISDYLDVASEERFPATVGRLKELAALAKWFGADRIRTFAGSSPSMKVNMRERQNYADRLRILCGICAEHGLKLLVETHPDTLADHLASARSLIDEVGHESLSINLDFLHLWEAGDDPLVSYEKLKPWVQHFHLKNVSSAERLGVFQPNQVYAASGDRDGIVTLDAGALDYRPIIEAIQHSGLYASLEWFGPQPYRALASDIAWLRGIAGEAKPALAVY
ncbi:sugar phosphate isomerase/epimerase [Paenibacillus oenotherae]|uniref:Sugar phosphate isomerase/epimerase n=1 Tax=Paenibacillus oenotherae TaxID=1435645 RepID=A0ABS7D505_9BACL|nr:sugar phosphate isomerase/epimerase family protein [Paenibacillus oenotherae]MBW7474896.1 sugar phosphate isomerase/epimerase [Paenibacillus oenotherae]